MGLEIKFGEIEGIEEGHWFPGKDEMKFNSFFRNPQYGIDGSPKIGASAIVLSAGYVDDRDEGDIIYYTGAGGKDKEKRKDQVEDQSIESNNSNSALYKSFIEKLPIRVIRGAKHKSKWSPKTGYLYGGLYLVTDSWMQKGEEGFQMVKFKLEKINNSISVHPEPELYVESANNSPTRKTVTTNKIVRDNEIAALVKRHYKYKCQICGEAIQTRSPNVFYAEAAHIQPLGHPHNGLDDLSNLLCLCPNHHKLFDYGAIAITDSLEVVGAETGNLFVSKGHDLNLECFKYHRKRFLYD